MARGRNRGQRDAFDVASEAVGPDEVLSPSSVILSFSPMLEVQDARRYAPYPVGPRSISGGVVRLGAARPSRPSGRVQAAQSFHDPRTAIECVRRSQRREVIFAKRLRRKGAAAKRRRRDWWSAVKC